MYSKIIKSRKAWNAFALMFGKERFKRPVAKLMNGKKVKRLIFVCTGNICRSPFAEAEARRVFGDQFEVISRGLEAIKDDLADKAALSMAREFGVDLSGHRARTFSASEISEEDIVFVMDQGHFSQIRKMGSHVADRVALLGAFSAADGFPLIISDPWGLDEQVFRKCFLQIQSALKELARSLQS